MSSKNLSIKKIALIPARGGSKRIPKKNIRLFNNLPMISYSINAAINSKLFDSVFVSTDDKEIAKISKEYGAEIPFLRPKNLSDDYTGTNAVAVHLIKWLRKKGYSNLETLCLIYATAPFISSKDLIKGWNKFKSGNWKFILSATEYNYPIQRSFMNKKSKGLTMLFPEKFNQRSQDLDVAYHDAGQFYWGKVSSFLENKPIFNCESSIIKLPKWRVVDIDDEEDWTKAEIISESIFKKIR